MPAYNCVAAVILASVISASCVASASTPSAPSPVPTATATAQPPPTARPSATATQLPTRTATPPPTQAPTATKPPPTPTVANALKPITVNGIVVRGPDSEKVAITFDMGSVGGSTLDLLRTLKNEGVRSTFFVTGAWSEANQPVLKAIVAAGHELGNHSYTHPDFTGLKPQAMLDELAKTEAAAQRIAGASTKPFFRPPFGAYDQNVLRVVGEAGYKAIYWTLDGTDWRDDSTVASVIELVLKHTDRGSIVVMHGALQKTADAVTQIVPALKARGLRSTTLSDLMAGR